MESTNYIQLALDWRWKMDLMRFIEVVSYPINTFHLNKYWHSLVEGHLYYVDDLAIVMLGIAGLTKEARWAAFKKVLESYRIGIDFYHMTNEAYARYLSSSPMYRLKYPPAGKPPADDSMHHLLIEPSCLASLMQAHGELYRHYLDIMELSRVFAKYESLHSSRSTQETEEFIDLGSSPLDTYDMELMDYHRNAIELARESLARTA